MSISIDKVIEGYLHLRTQKEALAKKQKDEMAPINANMEKVENWLMGQLNLLGTDSVACRGIGTAYIETKTDSTVEDWDATWSWIQTTGSFEFLERRVSKTVVKDYLESHGEVPPGIKVTRENVLRVRKT